jgi:hypothetical protein
LEILALTCFEDPPSFFVNHIVIRAYLTGSHREFFGGSIAKSNNCGFCGPFAAFNVFTAFSVCFYKALWPFGVDRNAVTFRKKGRGLENGDENRE